MLVETLREQAAISVTELLEENHRAIRKYLSAYLAHGQTAVEPGELCSLLRVHEREMEEVVYPAVQAHLGGAVGNGRLTRAKLSQRRLEELTDAACAAGAHDLPATLDELVETAEALLLEESTVIFDCMREALSSSELARLGGALLARRAIRRGTQHTSLSKAG